MSDNAESPAVRPVAVTLEQLEGLNWPALFGNENPVELEIGVGKAGFLLDRARRWPQRNFFGIEWAGEFYRFAVDRMERWGVPNVRLLHADAAHFIRVLCPRESLSILHVYHPDPWPKRRHHKRRLFQPVFVNAAVECLLPGARWRVQTDHVEYFEVIAELLRAHPQLEEIPFEAPDLGAPEAFVATNFQIKYQREGREFHRIAMRRREEP